MPKETSEDVRRLAKMTFSISGPVWKLAGLDLIDFEKIVYDTLFDLYYY